jgi:6-pyruvoyltetrahydropterin/6-carboxytetrahydropterin synthase
MKIRKLFKAEMAHEVPGAYTTRCHHLHGHSYKFELFLRSNKSNDANMVADFKGVKDTGINDFFDSFDHAVMLWDKDPLAALASKINPTRHVIVPFIPTAEMMAKAFFVVCQAILETQPLTLGEQDVVIDQVTVHETETGFASYGLADVDEDRFPDIEFHRWLFSDGIRRDWQKKDWASKVLTYLKTSAPSS